jgi:hypothetical protein
MLSYGTENTGKFNFIKTEPMILVKRLNRKKLTGDSTCMTKPIQMSRKTLTEWPYQRYFHNAYLIKEMYSLGLYVQLAIRNI